MYEECLHSGERTIEGGMMAIFQLPARRLVIAGGFAVAIAVAPAVGVFAAPTGHPAPRTVADNCPTGGVSINLMQIGAPPNCAPDMTAGDFGTPSENAITACSGKPGCLSNTLYGPGNVQVPNRDTTVRQSQ
jgi:hypothetical protein